MLHVKPLHVLSLKDIKFAKPTKIIDRDLTIIRFIHVSTNCFGYQTLTHHLCYPPFSDRFGSVSFVVSIKDDNSVDLKSVVEFESNVFTHINKHVHTSGILDNKTAILMGNPERNTFRLRDKKECIVAFDSNNEPVEDISRCYKAFDRVKYIIRPEHLWISKTCYGINYNVLQVKDMDYVVLPTECMFDVMDNSVRKEDEERYIKMKKMGVLVGGIQQKMLMDGYTQDTVQLFIAKHCVGNVVRTGGGPPPPPGPPPPCIGFPGKSTGKPSSGKPEFLTDIESGNFKLRKTQDIEKDRKEGLKNKVLRFVDKSKSFAPSLEDILNVKSKLRSVTR